MLLPTSVAAQNCAAEQLDETVEVAKVTDGDTLRLHDGRSVRLIGINSPELARKGRPAEPLAEQARDVLKAMLPPQSKVGLQYGRELHDRYKRLLAHVYLINGESIEARMLEAGLAAQIVVPPNVGQLDCYRAAEQRARKSGKGVWSNIYRPIPVDKLARNARGFHLITGRIARIGKSKKSLWLNFPTRPGEGEREGPVVRIARTDLAKFANWQPELLQGKTVIVRGWMYPYKKQQVMRIRHPANIEILQ